MKHSFAIANFFTLGIIIAWSSAATAKPTATQLAKVLINKGKYTEAISACSRAINGNSKDKAAAYSLRGATYSFLNQYQKTVDDCTEAIKLNAKDSRSFSVRRLAYYYLKQNQNAIADCSKAIALDPTYADAYFDRASAHNSLKEYEQAKSDLSRSIELKFPESSLAYGNRGLVFERLGKFVEAREDYDRAIALDSKSSWTYYHRAELNLQLHQNDAALIDCNTALKIAPKQSDVYLLRGEIYERLNLYKPAIESITEAIRLKHEPALNYCAYAQRAFCRSAMGDRRGGISDLDHAVNLVQTRLSTLSPGERKDEVREYASWLYSRRAWMRKEIDDKQGALNDYNEAVKLGSNDPMTYHERGFAYFDLNQFSKAVHDADTAISFAKQNFYWHHYLLRGRAQAALGDNRAAIESFNQVIAQLDWTFASTALMYRSSSKFAVRDYLGGSFDCAESIGFKYFGRLYIGLKKQLHIAQ